MRRLVIALIGAGVVLLGSLLLQNGNASVFDKKTILTFNQAVQIPGMVLDPGTYVLKRTDPWLNPKVVSFLDSEERHMIATVFALPVERQTPTSEPEIHFAETRGGTPPALKRWFYPGDLTGAEFVYPKESTVLASVSVEQPPITYREETFQTEGEIAQVRPSEEPMPRAEEAAPSSEQPAQVETEQEFRAEEEQGLAPGAEEEQGLAPAAEPEPAMPQTAGILPLLVLAGGAAFGIGAALKAPSKQRR
ncbi:MAG: hypothetical protein HY648_07320 [Acidobacteria bacterium]|nr:hypothetical protein [Acidobacteriota bacterium]